MRSQPVLIITTRRSAEMSLVIVLVTMFFVSCTSPQPSQPAASQSPSSITGEQVYTIGERISFAKGGTSLKYIGSGWSAPESWGTWTDGSASIVTLKLSDIPNRDMVLSIEGGGLIIGKYPLQDIEVLVNQHPVETLRYTSPGIINDTRVVTIPQSFIHEKKGLLIIEFKIENPYMPIQPGVGSDSRRLGLALASLRLD